MAKREPLFSILLPTHNRADVLPFAIRSVLGQTLQDFELLIVGDGCTDGTAEIVRGFSDPRIVWFDLPKGPNFGYANRNVALRQVRGEHVAFMAHDDLWTCDHLELLLAVLERPGVELVYSMPLWVIPEGKIAPAIFNLEDAPTLEIFLARKKNRIPAGCVVHRRECLDKYGYWNEDLPAGGDWDMWARIIEGGGRENFVYFPEPTCLHFRADWRKKANFKVEQEIVWEQFHALEGFAPAPMRTVVPEGITEQEAVWQAMSSHPQKWVDELRMAIRRGFERRLAHSDEVFAWAFRRLPALACDTGNMIEKMEWFLKYQSALDTEIARLNEQNVALSKHQAALDIELADLENRNMALLEDQTALDVELADLENRNAALLEHQTALDLELVRTKKQNAALSERQATLDAAAASLESLLAWKLILKLRSIKQGIAPPGTLREKLWLRIVQNLRRMV